MAVPIPYPDLDPELEPDNFNPDDIIIANPTKVKVPVLKKLTNSLEARLRKDLMECNSLNPDLIKCTRVQANQWDVLLKPLPGQQFYRSFQEFKRQNNYKEDGIHLIVLFPEDYPNQVPFVYNSTPILSADHIFNGGFCISSLGKKFWTPTLSVCQPLQTICDFILYAPDVEVQKGTNSFSSALGSYMSIFTRWGTAVNTWGGPPDWVRNLN